MSESDSEIKEPFFGFEHHYHLRSRSQQTDPEPVRPRSVRPVPRSSPNNAAKRRPEIDISPSEASTKTEMADNAALIAALQGFTTAVATDAAARQNQMTQLFQVIGGQQQNQAARQAIVAAPPNAPVIRPFTVAVNSLPHFSGSADEDAHGFVDQVKRVAGLEEWSLMMEARVQKQGESCLEYALDKRRLCLCSPVPLPEADIIKALLRGLASPVYIAALTAQLPATFTNFLTRLRDLEQLGLSSMGPQVPTSTLPAAQSRHLVNTTFHNAPPPAVVPDIEKLFVNFGDKLINQLSASISRLQVGPATNVAPRGGGFKIEGTVPVHVKWKGKLVELSTVTVLRTAPFAFILGTDWIVKSKASLIVKDNRIEIIGGEAAIEGKQEVGREKKRLKRQKKKISKGKEQSNDGLIISDELIESLAEHSPAKNNDMLSVKAVGNLTIPHNSLAFIVGALQTEVSGTGIVKFNLSSKPGKEWVIPASVVDVDGRLRDSYQVMSNLRAKDLASGYWQVPVAPEDQEKTAFITPDCLYSFVRLPFGLNCAPTFDEHLARLDMALKALERAILTLNVDKCIFGASVVSHLGHVINAEGIHPESEKVQARTEMPDKNLKSLRAFLGLSSFYRRFIPDFTTIAQPIHSLLKKNAPVLAHFDDALKVTVQTDASQIGLGAVHSQDSGNRQRPVAFICRKLTDTETRYHANELELLAVVWALKKLRSYVYGRHFTIKTDSSAVKWMMRKKEVKGKFLRWIMELQEFPFDIEHVKGVENQVADALSRNPDESRSGTSDSGTKDALVAVIVPQKPVATHELSLLQQQDGKLRPIFTSWQSVAVVEGKPSERPDHRRALCLLLASPRGLFSISFSRVSFFRVTVRIPSAGQKFNYCVDLFNCLFYSKFQSTLLRASCRACDYQRLSFPYCQRPLTLLKVQRFRCFPDIAFSDSRRLLHPLKIFLEETVEGMAPHSSIKSSMKGLKDMGCLLCRTRCFWADTLLFLFPLELLLAV
ncbi:Uncharacterized protein APZ42_013851 [Daphnia magna]|uniref:Reverse transcriptase RNase H-like domain-containing protein n=1 Tax=Daphnia magna TaxID=35525 RepID=A0A162QHA2_9CRUS|nr:Uncharacterized protein APZ42_013851 [Daphnia magna]